MVRIALVVLASAVAGGCGSIDEGSAVGRAVARINSGSGISVGTPYGGGTLGVRGQRERAERDLHGWGGRPLGGIGALREGPPRWSYGSP
jgi:hypothetical protein